MQLKRREFFRLAAGLPLLGGSVGGSIELDYCARGLRYAKRIVAGKIPACELVQLACERQIRDLKQKGFGWKFSPMHGNRICRFIENLPHVQGTWDSKFIHLEDWQCFKFSTIFGWVDTDGNRRFRRVYDEEPRKNAKTTTAAGVGLYLFAADGERGAEVYCAARTRDQAKHTWGYADQMVRNGRGLRERFQIKPFTHHMELADGSVFRPLHRESGSLEGLNVHGGVIDELHAHDSRDVFDVLDSATGSRRQPLLFIITTAAADVSNVCSEQHDYVVDILHGVHHDDSYWGIIYTIDKEDDWTTQESAIKANPNYGVSVLIPDAEAFRRKALHNPQAQSEYKRKRLCIWGGAADAYFNVLAWREVCKADITLADVEGWEAFFALDLASKSDLAALMMLFRKGRQFACFGRYYLPEDALDSDNPNLERYRGWQHLDNFTLTDGNLIDYDVIEADLLEYARRFRPKEIAFDAWNATQLATRMTKKGLPMVEVPMTVKKLSEPMKTLAGMIPTGAIQHDGDPILTWGISNTNGKEDANENVYPRKSKDEKKIDPVVALLMGMNRAFATAQKRKPHCLTHGPMVLNLNA